MVDEFSSFARMPKPTLEIVDVRATIRDAVFLMQMGSPAVDVTVELPDVPMTGKFDVRLLSQVITNLIKNGIEAIEARVETEKGTVLVRGAISETEVTVDVIDNGIGLPNQNRQRLLEPYMTTREKGTGLGLAIVRKIVEEHTGSIELLDAPSVATGGHGAMMRLTFPLVATVNEPAPDSSSNAASEEDQLAPVAE
jgi:two-component system nitrogen regulation sensor histidine kinase NtrY